MRDYRFPESITQCNDTKCVVDHLEDSFAKINLEIAGKDITQPWGGYLKIKHSDLKQFVEMFFIDKRDELLANGNRREPKLLFIAPGKSLSWQYHTKRSEVWRVLSGPAAVFGSHTDSPPKRPSIFDAGDTITIEPYERHRLAALENWALVAEIWHHTDPKNPSNEKDVTEVKT